MRMRGTRLFICMARLEDIKTAGNLFDEIPKPDLVAWNIAIRLSCLSYGLCTTKHLLVFKCWAEWLETDETILVVTVLPCSALHWSTCTPSVGQSKTRTGCRVWNTMMMAFATHGDAEDAPTLFSKMLREKLETPDVATFLGVLWACIATEERWRNGGGILILWPNTEYPTHA